MTEYTITLTPDLYLFLRDRVEQRRKSERARINAFIGRQEHDRRRVAEMEHEQWTRIGAALAKVAPAEPDPLS